MSSAAFAVRVFKYCKRDLGCRRLRFFCFLNKLSELRVLTTFSLSKNDNQWVDFISLKNAPRLLESELGAPSRCERGTERRFVLAELRESPLQAAYDGNESTHKSKSFYFKNKSGKIKMSTL